jgi:5-methyltetrahydropteroyltriglutamate--homocysteine methyltransferase
MLRNTPPFRADHVGSLLRPPELKDARAKYERGQICADALRAVEDRCIEAVIAKQENIGFQGITDGEFRREFWHLDFLEHLNGVESYLGQRGIAFKGGETKPKALKVTGKVGFSCRRFVDHFRFVKDHTDAVAKMTIPAPSVLHYRGGRNAIDPGVYPTMEEFFADLGCAYRDLVAAFAAAGCTYLQLDDVTFPYLCDAEQRQMLSGRGDDPDKLLDIYAQLINAAVSGKSAEMRVTMHLCRGNFKSMWIGQGGYEPVADVLFNQTDIDAFFMEYDTERAGGFEPLRLVPEGKLVVLGIVTSKYGELEQKDCLKRRIDEACKYISLDQLCVSPQCGFASTEEGNLLMEDEQWAKLSRVVEVASEVWGSASAIH